MTKIGVANPVIGPGQDGFKAALNFMLTLRPGIKTLKSFFDTVINALVVAGFEVQELVFLGTAPVTAEKRVFTDET